MLSKECGASIPRYKLGNAMTDEELTIRVQPVLHEVFDDAVPELLSSFRTGKSVAGRFRLNGKNAPESVFVKLIPDAAASGIRLDSFRNEITAYRVFASIPEVAAMTPRMLGYDLASRCLVLEDLGVPVGPNTSDLLNGSDPDAALCSLKHGVAQAATMHGATSSSARRFKALRQELGGPAINERAFEDPWPHAKLASISEEELIAAITAYKDVCRAASVSPAKGIDDEIADIARRVESDPGEWLAICKGDQNLAGDFILTERGPILCDFDAAGARHLFLEGMPARLTWGCMMRMPGSIVEYLDGIYQTELARWLPIAGDPLSCRQAMADAGARWHIFHVNSRLSEALGLERPRGPSTLRQQTSAWMAAFVQIHEVTGHHPALARTAKLLTERLTQIWTEEQITLPVYPAFAIG